MFHTIKNNKEGNMLMLVLVFGAVSMMLITLGISSYGLLEHRASNRRHNTEAALHIAEAGVEYYRWHLAHDPDDFWDGHATGTPGPFVHDFEDDNGTVVGQYSLDIDEPIAGSSLVTINVTGWTLAQPESKRTIRIRMGKPSLADFTFLQNANISFSHTTVVSGKVHSNGGIEFNGTTDAAVQSAKETYNTPYDGVQNGVWGDGGPEEFWEFPVPGIDFDSVSADLAALRDMAQDDDGFYQAASGRQGYYVEFLADGTFNLSSVTSRVPYCEWWGRCNQLRYDMGGQNFIGNYSIPTNGAMFFEDDVWVEGVVNGRVTLAVGRFPENPSTYREIYITGNITYNEIGSDDVLGLIAQGDIIVPLEVPEDMTIHAAALSQYGSIYRPLYRSNYQGSLQNSLTFFGSQISFDGGGWKYGSPPVSGFFDTNHIYDGNLRYFAPPGFPTGDTYELVSWEEVVQ